MEDLHLTGSFKAKSTIDTLQIMTARISASGTAKLTGRGGPRWRGDALTNSNQGRHSYIK